MHNIKLQPYQWNTIRYALFCISLCIGYSNSTQIIQQHNFIAKTVRTITLPLKIHNGVPYLQLRQLCNGNIIEQTTNNFLQLWPIQQQSQFQDIAQHNKQPDVVVLLDTGSFDFWLADHACSTCTYTKSLCPHLPDPTRKINYVKGYIEGVESYINLCDIRIKYLCVKSNVGMGQIQGEGILGIKQGSSGLNMLFNILKKKPAHIKMIKQFSKSSTKNINKNQLQFKEIMQLQFYMGKYVNNVQLISTKLIHQDNEQPTPRESRFTEIKCDRDWSFWADHVSLFNQQITLQTKNIQQLTKNKSIQIYIDTGSTKIIFSYNLCVNLIQQIYTKYNIRCKYRQNLGIDCNKIISNINFKIVIKQNNQKITLQIDQHNIINIVNNRLAILCQPPSITPQPLSIILGYPFLRSFISIFAIQTKYQINQKYQITKNKQINYYIKVYKQNNDQVEQYNLYVVLVFYFVVMSVSGWGSIILLDFIRDKRSKKIII